MNTKVWVDDNDDGAPREWIWELDQRDENMVGWVGSDDHGLAIHAVQDYEGDWWWALLDHYNGEVIEEADGAWTKREDAIKEATEQALKNHIDMYTEGMRN